MVYVITEIRYPDAHVKVGYASNGEQGCVSRLTALQVGNPRRLAIIALCDGSQSFERKLHWEFYQHHVNGEWFRREGIVADFIARHALPKPIASVEAIPAAVRQRAPFGDRRRREIDLAKARATRATRGSRSRYNPLNQLFDD